MILKYAIHRRYDHVARRLRWEVTRTGSYFNSWQESWEDAMAYVKQELDYQKKGL